MLTHLPRIRNEPACIERPLRLAGVLIEDDDKKSWNAFWLPVGPVQTPLACPGVEPYSLVEWSPLQLIRSLEDFTERAARLPENSPFACLWSDLGLK
jgi:hypothetical protein